MTFRAEPELQQAIDAHARGRGMERSEAIRDLVRRGLKMPADESGRREGMMRGFRLVKEKLAVMYRELSDDLATPRQRNPRSRQRG